MKTRSKIMIPAILALTMSACGGSSDQSNDHKASAPEVHSDHGDHAESTHAVKLNKGKPWQANAETTSGIKNMQAYVQDFSAMDDTASYRILKDSLESEFNGIFKACTMEGEAHIQLHSYLVPMLTMYKGLESDNTDTCKSHFQKLTHHLSDYPKYFE